MKTWMRRSAAVVALAAAAMAALTATALPAAALDGRVPDGRNGSAYDEIRAQYWHGLDRDPDPAGFRNYTRFVDENCRWGVIDGSYRILTSTEARNRWGNNPQHLAGMLYASLLNRAPDPGGLNAYTNAIRDRGLGWSVAQMMGSAEYRARLGGICLNPNLTATMYGWEAAEDLAKTELFSRAVVQAKSCAFSFAIRQGMAQIQRIPHPLTMSIGLVAQTTNSMMLLTGLDGTCGAAVAFMRAYWEVGKVINGAQYNPVFIQWSVGKADWFTHQRPFTVRVGSNPTDWRGFSGRAWG